MPAYLDSTTDADIVLLDLNLRDYSNPAANVAALVAAGHQVIVFSVHGEVNHVAATTEAGAAAYVPKRSTNAAHLLEVIRAVAEGESPLAPRTGSPSAVCNR